MFKKNNWVLFCRLYWWSCHQAFSFCSHSGGNFYPVSSLLSLESIVNTVGAIAPSYLRQLHLDDHVKVTFEDTDMLHHSVCSFEVTSSALLTFFSCLPHLSPDARAVCHGWFGNKMRKVLSQLQKSPFHLAPCRPFPLSHTRSSWCTHTRTQRQQMNRQLKIFACM